MTADLVAALNDFLAREPRAAQALFALRTSRDADAKENFLVAEELVAAIAGGAGVAAVRDARGRVVRFERGA